MLALFRIIKFALQDIFRNFSLSFMTVLILVLMILSVNTLVILRVLTIEATKSIEDQIDISLYFQNNVSNEEIDELEEYMKSFPEVTSITFVSAEEALASFEEEHEGDDKILGSLVELDENPFGPNLILKTKEPEDYQKIIKKLQVPEYEDIIDTHTFQDTETAIAKISAVTSQVERFTYLLTILFALIAFIIVFNTIRISIYTQRTEISIKKFVGASNLYVRGPYILEGLIFSIISIIVAFTLLFFVVSFLDPYIETVLNQQVLLTNYFKSNIIYLLSFEFTAVLLLTILSSVLAMRKYLKV